MFEGSPGQAPVLINIPHAGLMLPHDIEQRLTPDGRRLIDTDWHVHQLVDFAAELGVGVLRATHSRYVIDLNRGADDQPLYSGPTTGLVPTCTFDGAPLYETDPPDAAEVLERVERYWRPYHDELAARLAAIHEQHGHAVLLDAHSIRSQVPRLFEGRLPDLNLGTFSGGSCASELEHAVIELLEGQSRFSHVVNGRFKGGYITRHYGQPGQGIHALQMEIAQASYMDESRPEHFDETKAAPLQSLLKDLVGCLVTWRPA
ncbi:N-formylglutamate deformylase [Wenzhouxiangella sp. AB-CW3]|uniref:N-formylglutamate deformylase n=1 Tax=Wenzhouxiangella sp. AB-CW3 TaxID=2771012 RepID=UPI001CC30DA3|nr:N-formylglutamate deformylase [Wenzhouxiangella sp. AB-CW3]